MITLQQVPLTRDQRTAGLVLHLRRPGLPSDPEPRRCKGCGETIGTGDSMSCRGKRNAIYCTFCRIRYGRAQSDGSRGGFLGYLAILLALLLITPGLLFAQGNIGSNSSPVTNRQGIPLGGVKIAICQPLSTTAASVTNNIATLTMSSNPITAGYVAGMPILVSGFTGADTYFNAGTLTNGQIVSGWTILTVTSTTINFTLSHANASAGTNGTVLQEGSTTTGCAGLATVYSDPALSVPTTNPTLSDQLGNWNVFAASGIYDVQFYSATTQPTVKLIGVSPSSLTGLPGLGLNNIWTGNNTNTGHDTHSGTETFGKLNGRCAVDGVKYSTIASALADATCLYVEVPSGSYSTAATLTLGTVGQVLSLDCGASITGTVSPIINLTGASTSLDGCVQEGPFGSDTVSTIIAGAGATGVMVQTNIASGQRGAQINDIKLDGASIAATGLNIVGPVVEEQDFSRITFANLTTGIVIGGGSGSSSSQSQRFDHIHMQSVATCVDSSATGGQTAIYFTLSRFICSVRGFLVGQDDNVANDIVRNYNISQSEISITGNTSTEAILFRNCSGCGIRDSWIEMQASAGASSSVIIRIGSTNSIPQSDYVVNNVFNGNSVVNFAIQLNQGYYHLIEGNWGINANTKLVQNSQQTSMAFIVGNNAPGSGGVVDVVTGLSELSGNTTVANSYPKFPSGIGFPSVLDAFTTLLTFTTPTANRTVNFGDVSIAKVADTATLTLKKGSGAGNYTNATTSYTVADSTNLCYTVTIPTGWNLGISASGGLSTATAAVVAQAALTDNAACSTANAGILVETAQILGAAIGAADAFALNWVITGDGAAHNIALQFKTSNAADTASLINSSATITPTMKFELMPSN